MKINEFIFEIISCDGKRFSAEISELNVLTPSGMIGILKGHYPLVSFIDISTFNIKINGEKNYFAVTGATLCVKKNKVVILCDAFESREELDKDRLMAKKDAALKILEKKDNSDNLYILQAERSLKKALNRLSLLK